MGQQHINRMNQAAKGTALMSTLALVFVALLLGVFAVDVGFYYTRYNQLVTAANSGALAGTEAVLNTNTTHSSTLRTAAQTHGVELGQANTQLTKLSTTDVTMGSYNFATQTFSTTPSNNRYGYRNGYNAVQVKVLADKNHTVGELPSLFGKMMNLESYAAGARATAAYTDQVTAIKGGLRPIYGCQTQFNAALADGNPENNVIRIYGSKFLMDGSAQQCPVPTSGNWGFADLRDCNAGSVGASTIGDWFLNGYSGVVEAGKCYSTKPGNFISSGPVTSALDTLIKNKTVITIPLANDWNGSGSNSHVDVSGFAGFVIKSYVSTGNASNRYIEGYYTFTKCPTGGNCTVNPTATASTSSCPNMAPNPGGVVSMRLVRSSASEA
jgi:hypothetical protein